MSFKVLSRIPMPVPLYKEAGNRFKLFLRLSLAPYRRPSPCQSLMTVSFSWWFPRPYNPLRSNLIASRLHSDFHPHPEQRPTPPPLRRLPMSFRSRHLVMKTNYHHRLIISLNASRQGEMTSMIRICRVTTLVQMALVWHGGEGLQCLNQAT
jgi:hypothetical protein